MTLHALDPDAGPTLWLRAEDRPNHREGPRLELITGSDPEDPVDVVPINRRELIDAASIAESYEGGDE